MCEYETVRLMDKDGRPIPRPTDTTGTWEWPKDPLEWPEDARTIIPRDWVITWATRHNETGWWTWPMV